jgi:N6-L-threonylcarbamoyladenine synthase
MLLAIETSCDDTAAAVLDDRKVLSNCIANQNLIHKAYGGIVPELASRAHQSKIVPVISQALVEANIDKKQLTAIAYTQGPGLLGSLLVGGSFAKSMALALDLPLIPVNHMHAHLLVHFIEGNPNPEFPFLGITLSGGHTQLILVRSYFNFELIGTTLDDAIGEAFDKCGKVMGLSYPAGQEIDKLAKNGDKQKFSFPIANPKGYNVSYSGIKTAFINFIKNEETKNPKFIKKNLNDLCASLQNSLIQTIINKIKIASNDFGLKRIVIGGGVAANSEICIELKKQKIKNAWELFIPPIEYTTDNAAMIGIGGYFKLNKKKYGNLSDESKSRLQI